MASRALNPHPARAEARALTETCTEPQPGTCPRALTETCTEPPTQHVPKGPHRDSTLPVGRGCVPVSRPTEASPQRLAGQVADHAEIGIRAGDMLHLNWWAALLGLAFDDGLCKIATTLGCAGDVRSQVQSQQGYYCSLPQRSRHGNSEPYRALPWIPRLRTLHTAIPHKQESSPCHRTVRPLPRQHARPAPVPVRYLKVWGRQAPPQPAPMSITRNLCRICYPACISCVCAKVACRSCQGPVRPGPGPCWHAPRTSCNRLLVRSGWLACEAYVLTGHVLALLLIEKA